MRSKRIIVGLAVASALASAGLVATGVSAYADQPEESRSAAAGQDNNLQGDSGIKAEGDREIKVELENSGTLLSAALCARVRPLFSNNENEVLKGGREQCADNLLAGRSGTATFSVPNVDASVFVEADIAGFETKIAKDFAVSAGEVSMCVKLIGSLLNSDPPKLVNC